MDKTVKHILIVHGYLFQGSGSNIYVKNIAMTFKKMGHKVTVVCQDRNAGKLSVVDDFIEGEPTGETRTLKGGELRIVVPNIDNLLPVYIWNEYAGYTVKAVQDMTQQEIENHITKTGNCLKAVHQHDQIDMVIANHALLSPIIVQRAFEGTNVPYTVKIHGSAVTYNLKPFPHLMKWSAPGLKHAHKIIAGTDYIRDLCMTVFKDVAEDIGLKDKLKIVPPGIDEQIFNIPKDLYESDKTFLTRAEEKIKASKPGRKAHKVQFAQDISPEDLHTKLVEDGKTYNQRVVDADLLEKWLPFNEKEPIVFYMGAFLGSKGVGELIAIAPSLIRKRPQLRFVFCGFGTYRQHMDQLLYSFEEGNLQKAKKICQAGDFVTEINIEDFFFQIDETIRKRITIVGFVEHSLLSAVLPLCAISVVPSKANEAFGMVNVESMAAGVLPLCNNHSGLADVLDFFEDIFPELISITKVNRSDFFPKLPELIIKLLDFRENSPLGQQALKNKARQVAVDNFSWQKITAMLFD